MLACCSPRCPAPLPALPPATPCQQSWHLRCYAYPFHPGTLSASKAMPSAWQAVTHGAANPKRSRLRAWAAARRTSYPHPRNAKPCGSASECLLTNASSHRPDVAYGAIGDVGPFRRTSALKHNVRYVPLALPPGLAASCSRTPAHSVAISAQKTVFRASAEAHNPVFGLKRLLPDPFPTTQRRLSMLSPLQSRGRVLAGQ